MAVSRHRLPFQPRSNKPRPSHPQSDSGGDQFQPAMKSLDPSHYPKNQRNILAQMPHFGDASHRAVSRLGGQGVAALLHMTDAPLLGSHSYSRGHGTSDLRAGLTHDQQLQAQLLKQQLKRDLEMQIMEKQQKEQRRKAEMWAIEEREEAEIRAYYQRTAAQLRSERQQAQDDGEEYTSEDTEIDIQQEIAAPKVVAASLPPPQALPRRMHSAHGQVHVRHHPELPAPSFNPYHWDYGQAKPALGPPSSPLPPLVATSQLVWPLIAELQQEHALLKSRLVQQTDMLQQLQADVVAALWEIHNPQAVAGIGRGVTSDGTHAVSSSKRGKLENIQPGRNSSTIAPKRQAGRSTPSSRIKAKAREPAKRWKI